tara:strand:+ start:25202 stop:25756 length:555 start_codon:yes stop_codon:yes gene_type:complete
VTSKAPDKPGRTALLGALFAASLLVPVADAAQPQGPVEITADKAVFEQNAGTGVYQGNAVLVQGNRRMRADVIRLFTENEQLVRVEASGNPVRMNEGTDLEAHAQNLVYDLRGRQLILTGNAYVKHQGNTFEGAKVEYNLDSRRVDASSEGDKRVRLVIPASNSEKVEKGESLENGDANKTETP